MAITGVTDYTDTYTAGAANKSSTSTQEYINELRQKYPNVNITVADFKNEKQEDNYMFGCSGGNNIVIPSNIMEQMASDPTVAAKYEKYIAEAPKAASIIKDGLAAYGSEMIACGTSVDKNGRVTYWSIGRHKPTQESPAASYQKSIQERLEEKRAKKKEEEALKEKKLEKAESIEKLLESIKAKKAQPDLSEKVSEAGRGTQLDIIV